MRIHDRVYGEIEIKEKVIQELIQSKPMQRLKGISQSGATKYILPRRDVNRFEHCVGVWYLASLYGRPVEEQIASLLHDVPHTAFSHVADRLFETKDDAYHERFLTKVVYESEIPEILKKHEVEIEMVLDEHGFPLLHNELPDISLDRFDYFLRDGHAAGIMPNSLAQEFLGGIRVKDDTFYFEDLRLASIYAILFMNSSRLLWLDPTSHGSYFLLAKALRVGLDKGVIVESDLFLTDDEVMEKLKAADIREINENLERLIPGKEFSYADRSEAEFYGKNKPRYVDPWVQTTEEMKRVSQMLPGMKEYFAEFAERYGEIGVIQA